MIYNGTIYKYLPKNILVNNVSVLIIPYSLIKIRINPILEYSMF